MYIITIYYIITGDFENLSLLESGRHASFPVGLYLTMFYSEEELKALRDLNIREAHQPHRKTSFIIYPADPTYNCACCTHRV
jgi:hypothetical protein